MAGTIKTASYVPGPPPATEKDLTRAVYEELQRISEAISRLSDGHFDPISVAPLKPRLGDTRYADGTNWNPGCGEGLYCYTSMSWVKCTDNIVFQTPSSVSVVTGGTATGTVAGVQTWNDGSEYSVAEVSGVPGFDIEFTIPNVINFSYVSTNIHYDGTSTHDVELQIYNTTTTTWDLLTQIPTSGVFNTRFVAIPADPANYISSGNVLVRAYHVTSGNASHDIHFDYVAVGC